MSASSLENSTDNASVLISRSLREDYLDTRLDMVSHDDERIKSDLTKRRTMLVAITGLEDKPMGEESVS